MEGLDETYGQAMERIDGQRRESRELSKKILMWVVFARRPLLISELRYALAVQPDSTELDEDFLPSTDLILSLCGGLVTVDNESGIIRLVHYTTQQYLLRTRDHWSLTPQADITSTCITYLSFDTFGKQMCQTDEQFGILLQLNPFYIYAAQNWGHHFLEVRTQVKGLSPSMLDIFGQDESELQQLQCVTPPAYSALKQDVLTFLESKNHVSNACRHKFYLGSGDNWWKSLGFDSDGVPSTTGMHIAAEFGLVDLVLALLAKGHDPCALDSDGRTPLYCAAINGHKLTVRLLLAQDDVDVNSKDILGCTQLSRAAEAGYERVVKLLLARNDIDVKDRDKNGLSPLSHAASHGHEAVVKLLLAHGGFDINARDIWGNTPLALAAQRGQEAVGRLLLTHVTIRGFRGFGG